MGTVTRDVICQIYPTEFSTNISLLISNTANASNSFDVYEEGLNVSKTKF